MSKTKISKAVAEFLEEIVFVCKKHNMSISNDETGYYYVETFDDEDINRIMTASDWCD